MSAETTGCVVCTKPRTADVGYLCRNHLERLAAMLREVEDEAAMLSAVPSMQVRSGSRSGSLASERAPARLEVLVHTDRRRGTGMSETEDDELAAGETLPILDVLHSWARIVRAERNLTDPITVAITGERDTLTRALSWMAAQPWIDECYGDVRQLLGQLKAANGHRAEQPYSHCPSIVNGQNCTGDVWLRDESQAVWRIYTDRCAQSWEQAPGAAVCDTCSAIWATDADKARLKRMVSDMAAEKARPKTEDGRRMLTAEELVALGRVSSVNNVRVRAHRLGIASVHGHYDPNVFADKATA